MKRLLSFLMLLATGTIAQATSQNIPTSETLLVSNNIKTRSYLDRTRSLVPRSPVKNSKSPPAADKPKEKKTKANKELTGRQKRNRNIHQTRKERPQTPEGTREQHPTSIRAKVKGPAKVTVTKGVWPNHRRRKYDLSATAPELVKEWSHADKTQIDTEVLPGGSAHFNGQGRNVWTKNHYGAATAETWSASEGRKSTSKKGIAKAASAAVEQPAGFTYDHGAQEGHGRTTVTASNSRTYSPERTPERYSPRYPPFPASKNL